MLTRRARQRLYGLISVLLSLAIVTRSSPLVLGPALPFHCGRPAVATEVRHEQEQIDPNAQPVPTPSIDVSSTALSAPQPDSEQQVIQAVEGQAAREPQSASTPPSQVVLVSVASTPGPPRIWTGRPVPARAALLPPPLPPGLTLSQMRPHLPSAPADIKLAPDADIALAPGWNLVSIPEELADPDPAAAVLSSIAGSYERVYPSDGSIVG